MSTDKRKLFGTDGIRGVAEHFPLDRETTAIIGEALGHFLLKKNKKAQVVIGEDTRESSFWITECVAAGLGRAGIRVKNVGVITTPGVAFLARTQEFDAGIVISASHNPWTDNGIKVFAHDGYKLTDNAELEIEREIFTLVEKADITPPSASSLEDASALHQSYVQWLKQQVNLRKMNRKLDEKTRRMKVVFDCANGAASQIAAELFEAVGCDSVFMHRAPNGRNINEASGALHPELVAREVRLERADLGVTFDGDADRALFADHQGNVVNGDAVLLLTARHMQSQGTLTGNVIVATTMSNMGLEIALQRSGIQMLRAPVGDKYVLEEMLKSGAVLGGEQSGHIIFRDGDATTGDGLLTALRVLEIVVFSGNSLAELVADLKVFPQVIKNVRVREKKPFSEIPHVAEAIAGAERDLKGKGRVVVRYSGTESLARVMVEAESEEKTKEWSEAIASALQTTLGA
jgi:phosphoglucosamine mutase